MNLYGKTGKEYPDWQSSAALPEIQLKGERFKEYEKNEELSKILEGKKVAYVGPSPHLKGGDGGKHIDSYDIVIRAGQLFEVPKNLHNDYGKRTDILFGSFNNLEVSESLKNLDYFKKLKYVVCSMVSTSFINGHNNFFKQIENLGTPTHNVDDRYLFKIFKEVGTTCNCGFAGLLVLLNYNIKEVFVTGMSFYNMGRYGNIYHDKYYDTTINAGLFQGNSNKKVSKEQARDDLHRQQPQIECFRKIVNEMQGKIKLDKYLTENL